MRALSLICCLLGVICVHHIAGFSRCLVARGGLGWPAAASATHHNHNHNHNHIYQGTRLQALDVSSTDGLHRLLLALRRSAPREEIVSALGQVSLEDLPSRDRLLRIGAVATSKVCHSACGEHLLSVHVVPAHSTLPLHSRGGTVTLQALGASSVVLRDFRVSSVESPSRISRPIVIEDDGFIQNNEDDCVCRGGMCPRQYGCVFWVEKQLRDSGMFYLADLSETTVEGAHSVTRRQDVGPRELVNLQDRPAVLLELLSAEEDVTGDTLEIFQFFHHSLCVSSGGRQQYKVTASAQAVGSSPMYIDGLVPMPVPE